MRLSSLFIAALLLFSSSVVAQHTASAPGAPSPSPAPSAASNTAPSTVVPHTSPPSAPTPASVPETRVAPTSGSTVSGGSVSPESHSGSTAVSPTPGPIFDAGRLIPDQKLPGDNKIVSAPRLGQDAPAKEPEMKPGPPGHRICDGGPCKEEGTEWKADPPRSDLRRRICSNGPCPCPAGQTTGKGGGCVVSPPVAQPAESCQPDEIWNGAVCTPSNHCAAGEFWNGANCVASAADCGSIDARAAILVSELRGIKAQIQGACGQNPPGQDCEDLKQQQMGALQRYQMLLGEAGPRCQATLVGVGSLE